MKRAMILAIAVLMLGACGKKQEKTSDEVNSEEVAAEAALQSVGGMADEQEGASFATYRTEVKGPYDALANLFLPRASAIGGCSRAVSQVCNAGERSIEYDNCELPFTAFELDGEVSLHYSSSTCSMADVNNTVTRTYDFTLNGPRGASIHNFSTTRTSAIDNTEIGGGGQLTRTTDGWQIAILGKHKVATTRTGRTLFDISVTTSEPIVVTGSLARSNRTLASGQVDVHHNLAGFKASFVPDNVQYSSTCCYPVSGSWSVTYTGSKTGNATLAFSSCGSATLTKDGVETPISLSSCE